MEALGFGLKFATGVKNYDMGKLLDIYYSHHDSDFCKGFVQGIITVSINCQNDEHILPMRYQAALTDLAANYFKKWE